MTGPAHDAIAGLSWTAAPHGHPRSRVAMLVDRPVGLFGGPLGLFGNDEFVVRQGRIRRAAFALRGRAASGATIDDDAEAGPSTKGDREELEKLGIVTRNHNPIARHAVRIISASRR